MGKLPYNELTMDDNSLTNLLKTIYYGTITEFRQKLTPETSVNTADSDGNTLLMHAVRSEDAEKVQHLLERGADFTGINRFSQTALDVAVEQNFLPGIDLLLKAEATQNALPQSSLKMHSEQTPPGRLPVISNAWSIEAVRRLVDAGHDLNQADEEFKREYLGLRPDATFELKLTPEEFQAQMAPRDGLTNPELMEVPFWREMVRTGENAYMGYRHYAGEAEPDYSRKVWTYDRHGAPIVSLPDGRFVRIAGEHEDYYDSDFYIFNDITVFDGKGGFQIWGYPRETFPPTDFASATLVDNHIYIIGCIGYREQRNGSVTPVYRLTLDSWEIERVETTGENPGWIWEHTAKLNASQDAILIQGGQYIEVTPHGGYEYNLNPHRHQLDLKTRCWTKLNQQDSANLV
ncbi:Ankyrin [Planctopirus limnophila DSM 3776]|uniref:Ankyrin n=2 Tax=Planctopirus limnophila TaxID=120 RepID=D5SPY0_PLAL2|nr:Ankyrin [Planctopirus limnophila DSM 3776]